MKSLLFIRYYFASLTRKFFFEVSPDTFKFFYSQKLIQRINKKIPYYKTLTSLEQASVINKKIFLDHFSKLNAFELSYDECLQKGLAQEESRVFRPEPEGFSIGLSSGTSGKRGVFLTTESEQLKWAANLFTHLSWFSFFKKYRIGFILRANSPMYEKVSRSKRINFKFFDLMMNFDKLIADFAAYNPTVIVAPSYILGEIVKHKADHPEFLKDVKVIVSVADVLEESLEEKIQNLFKCPVHQLYQATEGFLAATCAHEKLHLNEDLLSFEEIVLDKASLRVVPIITDYFRETQAFVRYKLDDILVLDPNVCECGSKKRVVSKIEGRLDEVLEFNGVKLFPDYLRNAVQDALKQNLDFCIVKNQNHLVIKLACGSDEKLRDDILKNFMTLFLKTKIEGVSFAVEFNFERDLSMKRRRVYNISIT